MTKVLRKIPKILDTIFEVEIYLISWIIIIITINYFSTLDILYKVHFNIASTIVLPISSVIAAWYIKNNTIKFKFRVKNDN